MAVGSTVAVPVGVTVCVGVAVNVNVGEIVDVGVTVRVGEAVNVNVGVAVGVEAAKTSIPIPETSPVEEQDAVNVREKLTLLVTPADQSAKPIA